MGLEDIHSRCLDPETRTIYLHGDSLVKDEEPGVDYRMANTFIKNMDFLARSEGDINIVMGTIGGEWNYGMAIYDAIKTCKRRVVITAYGWARSMSSIILQAAADRVLMPHCDFMVHYGTTCHEGHYISAKSGMEFEARTEHVMLDIYAKRCVHGTFFRERMMAVENVVDFIDRKMRDKGDWWLDSGEAVYYGFADRVAV